MLILASASPRRRELLANAGIPHIVDAANVDESPLDGEAPAAYAERLARAKAAAVARHHAARIVLGADTVVVVDNAILGKPVDDADARRMLGLLSDREHVVLTAVAVVRGARVESGVARTVVSMRAIDADEIAEYVETGEPMDKAGAYAIQGGGAAFVRSISGDFDTVVGLSLTLVRRLLTAVGEPYSDT